MMIKIASDFSPYPGGRYRTDGDWNGQAFREESWRLLCVQAKRSSLIWMM